MYKTFIIMVFVGTMSLTGCSPQKDDAVVQEAPHAKQEKKNVFGKGDTPMPDASRPQDY